VWSHFQALSLLRWHDCAVPCLRPSLFRVNMYQTIISGKPLMKRKSGCIISHLHYDLGSGVEPFRALASASRWCLWDQKAVCSRHFQSAIIILASVCNRCRGVRASILWAPTLAGPLNAASSRQVCQGHA
jgi:hypothetical protein